MRRWLLPLLLLGCLTTPESIARSTPPTVVVTGLEAEELAKLRKAVPGVRLVAAEDEAAALALIGEADGFIGRPTPALVEAGTRLRWVQVYSAGVDRYRFPELAGSEIVLTNAKIVQGPNVADQAMALLLVLTRGLYVTERAREQHDWRGGRTALRNGPRSPIELAGKRALVVGLGGIGTAIAERAAGFGMEVVGIKRNADDPPVPPVSAVFPPTALGEQLGLADVVFLAVPLTDDTRGMMDAEALGAMKPDAFLVNIARGAVIDTDALVKQLQAGHLAGVGLDVTDPEPLPSDHPLWSIDRVVLTPHMGGTSDQVWARKLALLRDNLQRFATDAPLRNVVDHDRGY